MSENGEQKDAITKIAEKHIATNLQEEFPNLDPQTAQTLGERNFEAMVQQHQDQRKIDELEEKLVDEAQLDHLTKLPNRRALEEREKELLARGKPYGKLLLDIDRFKHINDTWGHPAGDQVLQIISKRLAHILRMSQSRPYTGEDSEERDFLARLEEETSNEEINGNEVAGRFGGEEFAILLPDLDENWRLSRVANKVQKAINGHTFVVNTKDGPRDLIVTASIGGKINRGQDPETFYNEVDQALYQAKREGRNQIKIY